MKRILVILLIIAIIAAIIVAILVCIPPISNSHKDTHTTQSGETTLDTPTNAPTESIPNVPDIPGITDKDTDGDGLFDHIEAIFKTDINNMDTDQDALTDYEELYVLGTNPLLMDTNENGVNDYDDDNDLDGLNNGYELMNALDPNNADSDFDGLSDASEINVYSSNPINKDTDVDGATDGWEVENGFNPVVMNEIFSLTITSAAEGLTVGVNVTVDGQTAEGITIEPAKSSFLTYDTIPGALSPAYEFQAPGELGAVELFFMLEEGIPKNDQIVPTIYCLNEEEQVFYEMETSIHDGTVQTVTTHFSTYILLDKTVYEAYIKSTYDIDYSQDTGVDSNNDGISDYLTKLMCDGVIRTGTGALVFGSYSYVEVQTNNDIDGDGIKNGDEIDCDYTMEIPDDTVEYNGHYYKVFDIGDFCISAQSYCESAGGYLCTITSQEEQNFVLSLLSDSGKNVYWLGGTKTANQWGWITGEDFSYTNWGPNEPNNMEGSENYLQFYAKDYRQKIAGDWNDASNVGAEYASDFYSVSNTGFICEWGSFVVNSHKYAFVNSSPIHSDTDQDGFVDALDPTPINPVHFIDLNHYIQHEYQDKPSATFIVDQPTFGSNLAINNKNQVGHAFILLCDGQGSFTYLGFYPAGWEDAKYDDYIDYALSNIYTRGLASTAGIVFNDQNHSWDVAYSKELAQEQYKAIVEYTNSHKKSDYNLQGYNCTTFAVNALEAGDFHISKYVSKGLWAMPPLYGALTFTAFYPYGYNPGQAGYDVMVNASTFIGMVDIRLTDGTIVKGVCDCVIAEP